MQHPDMQRATGGIAPLAKGSAAHSSTTKGFSFLGEIGAHHEGIRSHHEGNPIWVGLNIE
jgi:hypothetical protein